MCEQEWASRTSVQYDQHLQNLRGIDVLSGEATGSKLFCLPSDNGSILKGCHF